MKNNVVEERSYYETEKTVSGQGWNIRDLVIVLAEIFYEVNTA